MNPAAPRPPRICRRGWTPEGQGSAQASVGPGVRADEEGRECRARRRSRWTSSEGSSRSWWWSIWRWRTSPRKRSVTMRSSSGKVSAWIPWMPWRSWFSSSETTGSRYSTKSRRGRSSSRLIRSHGGYTRTWESDRVPLSRIEAMNVAITGIGGISAAGGNLERTLHAFAHEKARAGEVTLFSTSLSYPVFEVGEIPGQARAGEMRTTRLALCAVEEALTDAGLRSNLPTFRVGGGLGTPAASPL